MRYDFPSSHSTRMLFIHRLAAIKMIDIAVKIGGSCMEDVSPCFDKRQSYEIYVYNWGKGERERRNVKKNEESSE